MKRLALIILFVALASPLNAQNYRQFLYEAEQTPFIVISKNKLTLTLVGRNGQVIKQYGIAAAKNMGPKKIKGDNKTPEGHFTIVQHLKSGDLYHDFGDGKGPITGAYGPWFLRLDVPGFIDIGIHGTHLPESIGSRATEGCIRLKNEDILDLKSRVSLGTPVFILPDKH